MRQISFIISVELKDEATRRGAMNFILRAVQTAAHQEPEGSLSNPWTTIQVTPALGPILGDDA